MTADPEDRCWIRDDVHVATEVLDGIGVLFHIPSRVVFRLNATATDVWRRCDGSVSVGAIVDELAELHGVDREEVLPATSILIDELHSGRFLLTTAPPPVTG